MPSGDSHDLPSSRKRTDRDKQHGAAEVCRNCGAPAQRFVSPVGEEFIEWTQSELHTRRLRAPSAENNAEHLAEEPGTKKDDRVPPK